MFRVEPRVQWDDKPFDADLCGLSATDAGILTQVA
jgi:hypothetical protein